MANSFGQTSDFGGLRPLAFGLTYGLQSDFLII
jgi:hypothetical protein